MRPPEHCARAATTEIARAGDAGPGGRRSELAALLESTARPAREQIRRDYGKLSASTRPLLEHIEAHLFDPSLTLQGMRRELGIRNNQVPERFGIELGTSPKAYITKLRLATAGRLLLKTDLPAWEIALMIGYSGLPAFSRAFQRWAGARPQSYRRRGRTPPRHAATASEPDVADLRRAVLGRAPEEAHRLIQELRRIYLTPGSAPSLGAAYDRSLVAGIQERLRQGQTTLAAHPFRLPSTHLYRQLRRTAVREGRKDRARGVSLARLALESLELCAPDEAGHPRALRVEALVRLANAHRLDFDLAASERRFRQAEEEAARLAEAPPRLLAELAGQRAGLRFEQRRFDEALELCARALKLLGEEGDTLLRSKILGQRAMAYIYSGRPEEALGDLCCARRWIDAEAEPFLACSTTLNLTTALVMAGRLEEAERSLAEAKELSRRAGDPVGEPICRWAEARILHGRDRLSEAAALYRKARRELLRLGDMDRAAAIGLDLARLHLERGENQETSRRAAEVAATFESLGVARESFAALLLLQRAVERESLGSSALGELGAYLRGLIESASG